MRRVMMGLAFILGTSASGCVTYESVKAAAAVGQRVGAYEPPFDEVPAYCKAMKQAIPGLSCDLEHPVEIYVRAALVIGKYSDALEALASSDAVGARGLVDGMFTLAKDARVVLPRGVPTDTISAAVNALVDIAADAYKKATLESVVARAAPHVAALAAELHAAALVQRDQLESLEAILSIVNAAPNPPPGLSAVTSLAAEFIRVERARLALYDAAVLSFAAAHEKLRTHPIDSRDEDLLLLKSILAIVDGTLKDTTAAAAKSMPTAGAPVAPPAH